MGIALLLMGTDITFSFLAAFDGLVTLSSALGAVLAFASICVSIGIIVIGGKLIRQLKMFSSNGASTGAGSESSPSERSQKDDNATSMEYSTSKEQTEVTSSKQDVDESPERLAKLEDGTRKPGFLTKALSVKSRNEVSGKPSRPVRRQVRADIRYMTNKIMALAVTLILTAVVIFFSSREFVLFNPVNRAVGFALLYGLLSLQSLLKITFFIVPRDF